MAVNVESNDGWTPLHLAAWRGQVELVRLFVDECRVGFNVMDSDSCISALHDAADKGYFESVRRSLGLDVNYKDDDGRTLLHRAASNGHLEIVKLLVVEFKADVNAKDTRRRTPL